ncbi:hypothetical protein UA08_05645 [Talaromyces atroroseus]|uniref:CCZ1/INTU/HSP4 first Longin domain-containing protein n=1 Tax=Talaromyces atroroseus TaxID=1441469 RepID=A0A225AVD6_TALAT|nr:hypothetical protein UA08_05645 [Talaromyces atroroseus]OKL58936.1 hypothetical protein UA08_05645 [Talaromyces atroroseus]
MTLKSFNPTTTNTDNLHANITETHPVHPEHEMVDNESVSVVPAQLGFLSIYNPSLGPTDETIQDQIVFYYSSHTTRSPQKENVSPLPGEYKDGTNERLRKIGLAQGMVNFAKNFSNGQPLDSVETEKSRIVLYELESDWWILASIDLTRINSSRTANASSEASTPAIEYSSREVYPPHSLIQQLRRAHSIFLLHHGISLDNLYQRVGRSSFCKLLSRFWTRFIRHWLVLLNGNPATDLFNGVKLAVGGELGIGVGEEEWGSGEREVLEDYVARTHGLVDMVVSRFGDAPMKKGGPESRIWLGTGQAPRPSDGVIFSGVGAISRQSLASISHWMEWIYKYGEATYGVDENPSSARSRKRRKARLNAHPAATASSRRSGSRKRYSKSQTPSGRTSPGIPPPLVVGTPPVPPQATQKSVSEDQPAEDSANGAETLMKYLTLGYGSAWKFPGLPGSVSDEPAKDNIGNEASQKSTSKDRDGDEAQGKFIIGLRDNLEEDLSDDEGNVDGAILSSQTQDKAKNRRTLLRTLQVELTQSATINHDQEQLETPEESNHKKLQVLVYVHRPFMFTFLFDLHTPSLSLPSFYRSIHHQLGPLQRPLLSSTSPDNVSRRIYLAEDCDACKQKRASSSAAHSNNNHNNPIYDLVYDPGSFAVRSSIPNIPEPGIAFEPSSSRRDATTTIITTATLPPWSRVEALNVHSQFLSTYADTRTHPLETERTCKTSRGWWLIWMRIRDYPQQQQHTHDSDNDMKEAFLIRKASDAPGPYAAGGGSVRHSRDASSGVRFLRDLSGASSSLALGMGLGDNTSSPGKLTEGLGFDARRYIESLLRLNR